MPIEAVGAGIATCYLSKSQMTALLRQAEEEGLSRQQVLKRAVVALLVEEGKLGEDEINRIEMNQRTLAVAPHGNKKQVSDLRMAREVSQEDIAKRERAIREMQAITDRATGRTQRSLPTQPEPEPEVERPRRRRRPRHSSTN